MEGAVMSDEIRNDYVWDKELQGSIIPSAKGVLGGSYGFDPNNPNIKQNIIACDGDNQVKIAEITRKDMTTASDNLSTMTEDERVEYFKALNANKDWLHPHLSKSKFHQTDSPQPCR